MKKLLAMLLAVATLFTLAACAKQEEKPQEEDAPAYADSLEIMNLIWDKYPENEKFACFGGNQNENPVMDAAGAFDITDADGMSYLLLVPTATQAKVDDAASLVHMMNANTFTGAVVRAKDNAADVAAEIKESVMNNQFMCGMPDKLVVYTVGKYVIYAFGANECIDSFVATVTANVTGAVEVCNQPIA